MNGPDGTDHPNRVVYTEIKNPEVLKYDHSTGYEDDGKPPHFKSTITFEEVNGITKMELNMLLPSVEKRNEAAEFGAIEGGHQTLQRLDKLLGEKLSINNS